MPFVNIDAVKRSVQQLGEPVTVTHYTGDVSYDNDQEPTRPSSNTSTYAEKKKPNKFDIDAIGGDITINDKKFIIPGEITIDVGDIITVTRTSIAYEVKIVQKTEITQNSPRIIVFASKVE
jgi:hypothetical protein